jgi:hypothetical protein
MPRWSLHSTFQEEKKSILGRMADADQFKVAPRHQLKILCNGTSCEHLQRRIYLKNLAVKLPTGHAAGRFPQIPYKSIRW